MSELQRINRGVCPTPGKKQYRSQAEANRWQRQKYAGHGNRKERLYAYQCPSGEHWHLTHHTSRGAADRVRQNHRTTRTRPHIECVRGPQRAARVHR
ncbi:hypothetical protein I5H17_gp046 [Mycobacterium phage BodEinwohner17]|uniref:Uncharacterized protein n=1 Tax=Mycobacterium phage BodEinwohner17 TaxID=2708630 RepID=A0A6G6XRQ5_9CAUD|nr:hypothetical protein I5H17_gp046 [Mycobacterium phage BodEinwohner17]QIG61441.1 hypothetical protein SEA_BODEINWOHNER17_46 [Mycobacterium phage BodEinwohner17]